MWQKIRRFGVELYAYLTAPFVVKNYLGMLALLGGLFMLTFWWLKCYTNHGESVQVPSYVGMNFREALRKARSRHVELAVSDSTDMHGKAPGEVIMQDPKAESRVKEGRTLYFIVTKNNPDIIKLPTLAFSDDYDLYSRKLSRLGLKPRIISRVADPKLEANTIVQVLYRGDTITREIKRGYPVEMGATIDFVVSEAVTLTVNIPDCYCQTLDAAKFLIQTSELNVCAIIPDGTATDQPRAYVLLQRPKYAPNRIMRKGEQTALFITQNKPRDCETRGQ